MDLIMLLLIAAKGNIQQSPTYIKSLTHNTGFGSRLKNRD